MYPLLLSGTTARLVVWLRSCYVGIDRVGTLRGAQLRTKATLSLVACTLADNSATGGDGGISPCYPHLFLKTGVEMGTGGAICNDGKHICAYSHQLYRLLATQRRVGNASIGGDGGRQRWGRSEFRQPDHGPQHSGE